MTLEEYAALKGIVSREPVKYEITAQDIDMAIQHNSPFYEEYVSGMFAIRDMDIQTVLQIAEAIRKKTFALEDMTEAYASMKTETDCIFSHSMNVALLLSPFYCWWQGYSEEHSTDAIAGAMLHDVGKMYIDKSVLLKKGRLTPEERAIIMQHSALGYIKLHELLGTKQHRIIPLMAYQHHENDNGTGYPNGLHGKEIIPEARLLHIADVYDAMTSARCYKSAESPTDVTEYLMTQYNVMFRKKDMEVFLAKHPVYMKGDYVLLSNGAYGKVIKSNHKNSLRPRIEILGTKKIVDLYNDRDSYSITVMGKTTIADTHTLLQEA